LHGCYVATFLKNRVIFESHESIFDMKALRYFVFKQLVKNKSFEKDYLFTFESQTGTDFYGFHIVSSKINKCFYILLDYGDSLGNQIFYCISCIFSSFVVVFPK